MRLATYVPISGGAPRVAVVVGAGDDAVLHPFAADYTMRDVIAAGLDAARRLADQAQREAGIPRSEVRLLPPLVPASIRDSVAFEEHVEGVRRSVEASEGVPQAWYAAPTFYFTNPHTLIGDGAAIAFPASSVVRDFELEVAVVVAVDGSSLSVDEAEGAIFGYSIFNDFSARDVQSAEMQVGLGPAKGKDFGSSLGPVIVTPDEVAEFRDDDGFLQLECVVSVNGEEVGRDLLSNAGWNFATMIAYASRDSQVRSGDIIGSGTVGSGCLAELWGRRGEQTPPPLVDGDVVTLTVEGLGTLTNRVATAPAAPELPAYRPNERPRHRA